MTQTIAETVVAEMYRGGGDGRFEHELYVNREGTFCAHVFEDGSAMLTKSGTHVADPKRYTAQPARPVGNWLVWDAEIGTLVDA